MLKRITIFILSLCLFLIFTEKVIAGDEVCTYPPYPVCYPDRSYTEFNCTAAVVKGWYCTNSVGYTTFEYECEGEDADYCSIKWPGSTCRKWYLDGGVATTNPTGGCTSVWSGLATCNTSPGNCQFTIENYLGCGDGQSPGECDKTDPITKSYSCCGAPSGSTPTPVPTGTTPPNTCPDCGTYPDCWTKYCSPTLCPDGCSSNTCNGGVCSTPSCTVSFNSPTYSINSGSSSDLGINLNVITGTVSSVGFISSNVGTVSVTTPDTTNPYTTTAQGVSPGSSTITANVVMSGSIRCSATAIVYVVGPSAWWQVQDSDILANGNLNSSIPASLYFNLIGPGGFPGVPVYRDSTNLLADNVSVTKWLVNSFYNANRVYNSGYFMNLIPSDVSENSSFDVQISSVGGSYFEDNGLFYNGYKWFMYDGSQHGGADLSIDNAVSLGSTKVILFVKNANLKINQSLNLTKGSGFFLAITTGNISVDPTLGGGASANMEGIYVADGTFSSGTGGTQTDSKLWVRGSVAAYGGVSLQRDLGDVSNSNTPAEFFEYAPDQELLFPIELEYRAINWKEVAP